MKYQAKAGSGILGKDPFSSKNKVRGVGGGWGGDFPERVELLKGLGA